jgi:hypothetical protein
MSAQFVPDPSWPTMAELATELWGQPTGRHRDNIRVGARGSKSVRPTELHRLVRPIEADALATIDECKDDYADYLLRQCAELREAA